jgi:hypothetical protein
MRGILRASVLAALVLFVVLGFVAGGLPRQTAPQPPKILPNQAGGAPDERPFAQLHEYGKPPVRFTAPMTGTKGHGSRDR